MPPPPIKVTGLAEFTRGLKKISADLPKEMRLANNAAAAVVVKYAAPAIPLGPARGGHARSSVKAKSTRTEARVQGGGARYPYYPWLDFGGTAGRRKKVRRPFIREGRAIYPAYSAHAGEIYRTYVEALLAVAKRAGIEMVNGS
jgi:hypothetical protein